MFNANLKKLSLAALTLSGLTLIGCLQDNGSTQDPGVVYMKISTAVEPGNPGTALAKGSQLSYSKLIILLTSNATSPTATDTLRDTITTGEQGFTSSSSGPQTIDSVYVLKGLRTWKITATVLDSKDSITHFATVTPSSFVKVADTLIVPTLTLTSNFTTYEAKFAALPDSVTTTATSHKQAVKFRRMVLWVGGVKRVDTTATTWPTTGFTGTGPVLTYDYVRVGVSTPIHLVAYGTIGTGYNDSLFAGDTTITTTAGVDVTSGTMTLNWTHPNNDKGSEKVTVTISKVGKTTVTGTTSGIGVVPKGSSK